MSRRTGLARVAAVYGQVERLRLAELQLAGAAVDDAEQQRRAAGEDVAARMVEGRAALARGAGLEWRVAESSRAAAETVREQAEGLRREREKAQAEALESHRASRLRTEQVAQVLKDRAQLLAVLEARREQAAADDRYGARLRMKRG